MEELRSCMPLGMAKRVNNNKISKCGSEVMARGKVETRRGQRSRAEELSHW